MSSACAPCRARAAATAANTSRVRSVGARTSLEWSRTSSFARWKPNSSTRRSSAASAPPAIRCAAVRLEAAADHAEVGEQIVRALVAVVPEPPPHERELPPVRLARRHLHRPVARPGSSRSSRAIDSLSSGETPTSERLEASAIGEREHVGPVARERRLARPLERRQDRLARRPRGSRRGRRRSSCRTRTARGSPGASLRYSRSSRSPASNRLSSKNQSPCRISSPTRRPLAAHLVGLPEDRDLLGELVLELRALGRRSGRGRRSGSGAPRSGRARAAASAASPRSGAPSGRARARSARAAAEAVSAGTAASRSNASTSDSRGVCTSSA